MPTYLYKCDSCGEITEYECSMKDYSEKEIIKCSKCGSNTYRFFGNMNFILKGKDWPSKELRTSEKSTKNKQ